MNVEEITAAIRRGTAAAGQATATITAARDHGRDAGVLADATCHDSRHQHVQDGHARWTEADREAGIVFERLNIIASAAASYLEAIT